MRTMVFAVAASAAVLTALPFSVAPVNAGPVRMAQVDVDVGVSPRPRDRGVVIEERSTPRGGHRRDRGPRTAQLRDTFGKCDTW